MWPSRCVTSVLPSVLRCAVCVHRLKGRPQGAQVSDAHAQDAGDGSWSRHPATCS